MEPNVKQVLKSHRISVTGILQTDGTGTFNYHCYPHPNMIASVIVVD